MENNPGFHTKCPLCNSPRITENERYHRAFLAHCNNCRFTFSKKIPPLQELSDYYANYPLRNEISPITLLRFKELLSDFEKSSPGKKILDIGCGDGFFLQEALKRNWHSEGTEFNPAIKERLERKGIPIHIGTTSELSFQENSFDVITSFEVLEHLVNPGNEIMEIKRILKPSGLFYFTVPNFNSLSRRILKEKWNVIEYPEHLSYFIPAVIDHYLKQNGFEKIYLRTTGFSPARWNSSQSDQELNNDTDNSLRVKSENKFLYKLAKNVVNFSLNTLKMGDTIKGFYRKNKSEC